VLFQFRYCRLGYNWFCHLVPPFCALDNLWKRMMTFFSILFTPLCETLSGYIFIQRFLIITKFRLATAKLYATFLTIGV
jgi:hypothetical protein